MYNKYRVSGVVRNFNPWVLTIYSPYFSVGAQRVPFNSSPKICGCLGTHGTHADYAQACQNVTKSVSHKHTGVFALKIISNDAILLVKLISTTFAHLGSSRVSNEAMKLQGILIFGFQPLFFSQNRIIFKIV